MKEKKSKETKWRKLDNTAKIFPVIANEDLSNVYRFSVTLKDEIQPEVLQQALEKVLPWFDIFHSRLRRGVFWYYFETNKKTPQVEEEVTYPCRYIDPYSNNQYLFRVTYYKKRINLEVFHVITDGAGAINFLKELIYQYLRMVYREELGGEENDRPSIDCSFNTEDSYLRNYKKIPVKAYQTKKAFQMKGNLLGPSVLGVIHGYIDITSLKEVCKKRGVSITQYFCAILIWGIYKEYLNGQKGESPIRLNIPVNLRQYFESTTTMNFFAVLSAGLSTTKDHYTFEEILLEVVEQFDEQLTKENLEKLIAYNVSNEKNFWVRPIPLFLKNIGIWYIYKKSVKAFTTTISNVGYIKMLPEYQPYVEQFHLIMGAAKKQNTKCSICSYDRTLVVTFSSVLEETYLQKAFFKKLGEDGIDVKIETNGVYYEEM